MGFLTQSVEGLLAEQMPDGINVCVPGDGDTVEILGFELVTWGYCQQPECEGGERGCALGVQIGEIQLNPLEPNRIRATLTFEEIAARFDIFADGLIECGLEIQERGFPVEVELLLSTPAPGRELSFEVSDISFRLSELHPHLEGHGGGISALCDGIGALIEMEWLGEQILNLLQSAIEPMLLDTVDQGISQFLCLPCASNDECPVEEGGRCEEGLCLNNQGCIPRPMGAEGSLNLGEMLARFSPGLEAELQYLAALGSYAVVEQQGLSLGIIGGAVSERSRCVPARPQPPLIEPPRSPLLSGNLDPEGQPFKVGFGITHPMIDHALWAAFNSGALCVSVNGEQMSMLNTQTLGIALPGLSRLTRGAAPVAITLAPQELPVVELGRNRVEPDPDEEGQLQLAEPLLTITIPDLWIDFHAFMEQRWTRIFSLKADVVLPMGLAFTPENELIPLLGDLNSALQNIETANGEIMFDDPSRLEAMLPVLMGPLTGALAGNLIDPIALPEIMGYRLNLQGSHMAGIEEGSVLALFADLEPLPAAEQQKRARVDTALKILEVKVPDPLSGQLPLVRIALEGLGEEGEYEFSWRVAGGSWSLFSPAKKQTIRSPLFHLQGKHRLEVRARLRTDYRSLDPSPAEALLLIDSLPPELDLEERNGRIWVKAWDLVSADEALRLSWRLENGEWRPLEKGPLPQLEEAILLKVEDEAGNSAEAIIAPQELALIGRLPPDAEGAPAGGGCAQSPRSGDAPYLPLLGLLILLLFNHRRALLLLILALGLSCSDNTSSSGDEDMIDAGEPNPHGDMGSEPVCKRDEDCPNGICRLVDGLPACVLVTCLEDASLCNELSCSDGRPSFCSADGVCQCESFCDQGCLETQYCCYLRDACENPAPPCILAECDPGYESSAVDEGRMDSVQCERIEESCECVEIDPLEEGLIGRHSDLVLVEGQPWFSAYSETYGDLVVGAWEEESFRWFWVDGIPVGEALEAGPSGPRGGISAPGEDVGLFTSIAAGPEGQLHVAYYDKSNQALKYALGRPLWGGYDWKVMTLDSEEDSGSWAQISLNDEGIPGIAYRHSEGELTQLRYLLARSAEPDNPSAWAGALIIHETFIDQERAGGAYPEGTGLFTSQVHDSQGLPILAWYDRSQGALFWSRGNGAGFSAPEMLAGWSHPERDGDMGANVDITLDAQDQAHLCFQDGMSDSLRYLAPELGRDEWIDDGVRIGYGGREHALHVVGEDCQIFIDQAGEPLVIYQDATGHDLLLLRSSGPEAWSRHTLQGDESSAAGAFGFYLRAVQDEGLLWISSYVFHNDSSPRSEGLEIFNWQL